MANDRENGERGQVQLDGGKNASTGRGDFGDSIRLCMFRFLCRLAPMLAFCCHPQRKDRHAKSFSFGHHLIWTLYGHWLANDPRGSGSEALQQEKFAALDPIHQGRKPEHLQPSRAELREFQQAAKPLLTQEKFWLDAAKRQALGEAFFEVMVEEKYTVWSCAILSNHIHLVIRRHRDDALSMWHRFADATRLRLREQEKISDNHPSSLQGFFAHTPARAQLHRLRRTEPWERRTCSTALWICAGV